MQKVAGYVLTPLYLVCFGLNLLLFDILQRLAFQLAGYKAQQQMVYVMNWVAMRCIHLLGGRIKFEFDPNSLPKGRKLVFVANHQSMNDIPPMLWYFRKYGPVFIAKKELAKGYPGISYNYQCGGAVAIDRKDSIQALEAIGGLGRRMRTSPISICIFPEGTRARDGKLKKFQSGGIRSILNEVPDAVFVPVAIANSWKLVAYGFWPIPAGIKLHFKVLDVVDGFGKSAEEVVSLLHERIAKALANSAN